MKAEIELLEETLRVAMLNSDVATLDTLLSPDLLFTNHLGTLISKAEDLEAHRTKAFEFTALALSETKIQEMQGVVVVSTKAEIAGLYQGQTSNGVFRFTRVWRNVQGRWQIVAGHSCVVANHPG